MKGFIFLLLFVLAVCAMVIYMLLRTRRPNRRMINSIFYENRRRITFQRYMEKTGATPGTQEEVSMVLCEYFSKCTVVIGFQNLRDREYRQLVDHVMDTAHEISRHPHRFYRLTPTTMYGKRRKDRLRGQS